MTILASGVIYIELNDKARIRIDDDKSSLYVPHDTYDWIWVVGGREYNRLFDGTSRLNRDLSSIVINQTIVGDTVIINRSTGFKRGPMIVDTYTFKSIDAVELFPISHKVEIYNASGYFYRYSVDDLTGVPDKRKLIGEITLSFGRNIKVELHPNYRWAWIGWPYGSDSISAQYDIDSDYEVFNVRLFDPVTWWNSTWNKRKPIDINVSQNVTDYQFFINLTYDSDMQPNGSDLRVVCYDNMLGTETETSYWVESKSDSNYFNLWFNCSANTYNETQGYVYYDNSSLVASQSNLTATYWWSDTAEVGTYTDSWTFLDIGGGTAGYNANHPKRGTKNLDVNITGGANQGTWVYRDLSGTIGSSVINATYTYDWYDNNVAQEGNMMELNGQVRAADASTGYIVKIGQHDGVDVNYYTYIDTPGGTWVNTTIPVSTGFHKIEVKVFNGNYTMFIDDTYCGTFTYIATEPKYIYFGGSGGGVVNCKGYYDDIRIRKYIYPEPTYSIGAEEVDDTGPTVTLNTPADTSTEYSLTVNFVFTPEDDSGFTNCSLWTNETAWGQKHINTTEINNGSTNTISETFSSYSDFLWNVECYDDANNNSFATANYTVTTSDATVTLYFDHVNASLDVEQGTKINITANSSLNQEICLSADHGSIGDDYICANYSVSLLWAAESNIRKFNDSELSKLYNFSSASSINMTLYPIRNYSEIESSYINLSGISPYAKDIRLDFDGDGSIDWSSWGELQATEIVSTEFNNSDTNQSVTFTDRGVLAAYLRLPVSMNITSATLDIYGDTNDNYSNDYEYDVFRDSNRYTTDIYAPTIAYDSDNEYMYLFCNGALNSPYSASFTNLTLKQEIKGDSRAGVTEIKTDVPWKCLYSNAVYKSGANDGFYVYGGYNGISTATTSGNLYHYDPDTDVWTSKTSMPYKKQGHQSVLVDNDDKIYICGGYNESNKWNKSCFYYDISGNSFTAIADLPRGLENGWAEQLNSTHLLFYGGTRETTTGSFAGATYMYDIAGDSWSTMDYLPAREYYATGAKIGNHVYSFGGYHFSSKDTVYRYNAGDDDWEELEGMSYVYILYGTEYTGSVTFTNDECAEVDNHVVCYGPGGFGYGQQEYIMYFYPNSVSLLVEDYDTISESYSGDFTGKESVGDLTTEINDQLQTCTEDDEGYCNISLYLSNYGAGTINATNLAINTTIPLINLGTHDISCATTDCDINLEMTSSSAGNVNMTGISINFLGTSVINWTGSLGSDTDSLNMSIYHSDWDYTIANDYDYIEFIPSTPTSNNVTPYGQTSARGIFNITTENYGGKNMSWYMKVNETDSCVNLTIGNSSTYSSGHLDDATWYEFQDNVNYSTNFEIWMWADYDCNETSWDLWNPIYYFRSCCEGCTCSEEIS